MRIASRWLYKVPDVIEIYSYCHGSWTEDIWYVIVVDVTATIKFADQVSDKIPDVRRARSRIVRCSSEPSTRRLSTSENTITILLFCLFEIMSLYITC